MMLSFLAATLSATWPAALLVLPAVAGVLHLDRKRRVAPLVRGSFEGTCVVGASLVAAAGAAALLSAWGTGLDGLLCGAPVIGAIPWVAGEVLSGRSQRSGLALAVAMIAGTAAVYPAMFALMEDWWEGSLVAGGLSKACMAAALVAAVQYLILRGPVRGGES